ncbi:hypothetical protein CLOM_g5244 [Closterium sp. NIES-68]|nr:hypothetical protein CLOM_g5244 [Closterium sp. NIES-68]GJP58283.1 hypothetical protein CLOP_g22989 [Closterium sp. NIES-67]
MLTASTPLSDRSFRFRHPPPFRLFLPLPPPLWLGFVFSATCARSALPRCSPRLILRQLRFHLPASPAGCPPLASRNAGPIEPRGLGRRLMEWINGSLVWSKTLNVKGLVRQASVQATGAGDSCDWRKNLRQRGLVSRNSRIVGRQSNATLVV